jgi:HAE1 family hydrophobic/amphiphilic exporter-1
MTTFAFVAGMLPLVTSQGIGSGFSKAMASVVVGGQTLSLLLTLVAIPVIYTWFDDLAQGATGLVNKLRGDTARPDRGAAEVGVIDLHAPKT